MRNTVTALALLAAFLAALALYGISHDARRLETRVHAQERTLERTEADIAAARAELSHLSRPERIEPLARALGLAPPSPRQFVAEDRLTKRDPALP